MNKIIYVFISLSIFSITSFGQTIEQLKQENAALKKQTDKLKATNNALIQDTTFLHSQLKTCQLYNLSNPLDIKCSLSPYKITFIESKGNRQSQSVEVTILIENTGVNQRAGINSYYGDQSCQLIDSQGNVMLGSNYRDYTGLQIPTNTPYKIKLKFDNILPGTDFMSTLTLQMESSNQDLSNMRYGIITIKNIKTTW